MDLDLKPPIFHHQICQHFLIFMKIINIYLIKYLLLVMTKVIIKI